MRKTALVLAGLIGVAGTARAQYVYRAAAQYQQELQNLQPQNYSPTQQVARMAMDSRSSPSLVTPTGLMPSTKIHDESERMAPSPTLWPQPGSFHGTVAVTISEAIPGSTIYYTLDGTQPQWGSPQYTGPIKVSKSAHLIVIAVPPHGLRSPTVDGQYDLR